MRHILLTLFVLSLLLAGCSEPSPAAVETITATTEKPSLTTTPVPIDMDTLEPAIIPSQVLPKVCTPLAGVKTDQLTGIIVNPYHPPRLGSDDPHQGVDLAVLSGPNGIALTGATVQAILSGRVAGKTVERFPYGNMLLIETPLDDPLFMAIPHLTVPAPLPDRLAPGALTCPETDVNPAAEGEPRSLYILYAHLQDPVNFELGDKVDCGRMIGAVGSSGNALNPHLHVEVRVGPSGQTFSSMAHYDSSATPTEMGAYCTWRVSGVYQSIDPACLWGDCDSQ